MHSGRPHLSCWFRRQRGRRRLCSKGVRVQRGVRDQREANSMHPCSWFSSTISFHLHGDLPRAGCGWELHKGQGWHQGLHVPHLPSQQLRASRVPADCYLCSPLGAILCFLPCLCGCYCAYIVKHSLYCLLPKVHYKGQSLRRLDPPLSED